MKRVNTLPSDIKDSVIEGSKRASKMSNEEKANLSPYNDPYAYQAAMWMNEDREELVSLLDKKGTSFSKFVGSPTRESINGFVTDTYKIGNTNIQVNANKILIGVKAKKNELKRQKDRGHYRYVGNFIYTV